MCDPDCIADFVKLERFKTSLWFSLKLHMSIAGTIAACIDTYIISRCQGGFD
jgi:hypothetical protein